MPNLVTLFGLSLDAIGAFLVLAPDIPCLLNRLYRIPPLKIVEEAEKRLYMVGELERSDAGFHRIEEAILSGTRPFSDVPRLDELDSMDAMLRINGPEGVELERTFEGSGYQLARVSKDDDRPLASSNFTVEYYSSAVENMNEWLETQGIHPPSNPYITATIEAGRLPELVDQYKRRVISRTGAALLLCGFLFQIVAMIV